MILKLFSRVYKKILNSSIQLNVWINLISIELQTKKNGGSLLLSNNVQINQKTIVQGKGQLQLGNNITLGYQMGGSPSLPILLQPRNKDASIIIGDESVLMNGIEIIARNQVIIGKNCRIGAKCVILDSDFHGISPDKRDSSGKSLPVTIGDNVWLGMSVIVLKGVVIGNDAVIGAGCVVAKNIPAGGIAVGNPVRVIGSVYDKQ